MIQLDLTTQSVLTELARLIGTGAANMNDPPNILIRTVIDLVDEGQSLVGNTEETPHSTAADFFTSELRKYTTEDTDD